MNISWLSASAFKIEFKTALSEGVILFDPYMSLKEDMPRNLGADVVLASHGKDNLITLTKNPFIIDEAGEYERKQVLVYGFQTANATQASVIFRTEIEHVTVAHVGALAAPLSEELKNELNGVDVLLVPVGGGDVLTPERAAELVTAVEPRVVIPYCFGGQRGPVTPFLKALGLPVRETQQKIKLTKKDLPSDQLVCMVPKK